MKYDELFQKAEKLIEGYFPITLRTIFENKIVRSAAIEDIEKLEEVVVEGETMTWEKLRKSLSYRNFINDLEEPLSLHDIIERFILPDFLFPKIESYLSGREYIDDRAGDKWYKANDYSFCVIGDDILLYNFSELIRKPLTSEEKSYYSLWSKGISKLFPSIILKKHETFISGG